MSFAQSIEAPLTLRDTVTIITKALYGRFVYPQQDRATTEESGHRDEMIDVTISLQCLVKDSKLILHKASKVGSYNFIFYVKNLFLT